MSLGRKREKEKTKPKDLSILIFRMDPTTILSLFGILSFCGSFLAISSYVFLFQKSKHARDQFLGCPDSQSNSEEQTLHKNGNKSQSRGRRGRRNHVKVDHGYDGNGRRKVKSQRARQSRFNMRNVCIYKSGKL